MMLSKMVRVRVINQSNTSAGYESEVCTVSGLDAFAFFSLTENLA